MVSTSTPAIHSALALRGGEGGAGDQQQDGGAPGQVDAVRQADRQHDEAGADQAMG